jgi:signal transduction histidine kinase
VKTLAWIWKHRVLLIEVLAAWLLVSQSRYGQPSQSGVAGVRDLRPALALALILAIVLPLFWRRKAPIAIFAIIFAAALGQAVLTPDFTDDLALLVAFYTVADREPLRRVLGAVAALECGAVLAAVLYKSPGQSVRHLGLEWAGLSVLVAVTGLLGYYTRARRAYLERERERDVELAAVAERTRIAREMHDIVAHNLAVMIALADGAAYTIAQDPDQAAALIGHVSQTGRSALNEMRRLLGILRRPDDGVPGSAPQPALADLITMISTVREAGLPVRLTVSGQPFPLPPSAQLTLYRIVQEALTNVLKHADATSAHVRLTYQDGEVDLEVTDDGRSAGVAATAGHGLAGMRERAAVFGGEVCAGPRPEGGWRVHALLRAGAAQAGGSVAGTEET